MRIKTMNEALIAILLSMVVACQGPESSSTETTSTEPTSTETTSPEAISPESQSSCDRACLENYVDQYMDAMLANNPNPAPNRRFL